MIPTLLKVYISTDDLKPAIEQIARDYVENMKNVHFDAIDEIQEDEDGYIVSIALD